MATFTPIDENDNERDPNEEETAPVAAAPAQDPDTIMVPPAAAPSGMQFSPAAIAQATGTPSQTATIPTSTAGGVTQTLTGGQNNQNQFGQPGVANLESKKTEDKTLTHGTTAAADKSLIATAKDYQDSIKEVGIKQALAADANQQAAAKAAEFQQKQQAVLQSAEATRRSVIEDKTNTLNQLQQDYEKATIDPDHYWKQQPLGSKIMSLVAIGLSGLGNAYAAAASPGSNPQSNKAWEIVKGQIDNDIEAQKANLAKQGHAIGTRTTELSNLRQELGDQRMADAAFAAQQYAAYAKTLDAEAAKTNSPTIQAQAQMTADKAKQDAAIEYAKVHEIIGEHAVDKANQDKITKSLGTNAPGKVVDAYTGLQKQAVTTHNLADRIDKDANQIGPVLSTVKGFFSKRGADMGDFNQLQADVQNDYIRGLKAEGLRITPEIINYMNTAGPQIYQSPRVLSNMLRRQGDEAVQDANNMKNTYDARREYIAPETPEFRTVKARRKLANIK